MRIRIRTVPLAVTATLLALAASLAPTGAAAAPPNFCPLGSAAGRCYGPHSVAVDQSTGIVYIADGNNHRIDEFDSEGRFIRAFGLGVLNGAEELQVCTTTCVQGRTFDDHPGRIGEVRPASLAFDSSHHRVYVSESQTSRVQVFDEEGRFLFTFGNGVLDGGATGTGDLTAGSTEVTNLKTSFRQFIEGQTLTGAGIPAGTRIVSARESTLVLSQPATVSAAGVSLSAPTPPANHPVNEVQRIELGGAPTGGTFSLTIPTPRGEAGNIGGAVTATTSSGSPKVTSLAKVVASGDLSAGSTTITNFDGPSPVSIAGATIVGAGIPPGTTIVGPGVSTEVAVISQPATATASGVPLSLILNGSGDLTAGSNVVTNVSASIGGNPVVGETISGPGIPVGTTVVSADFYAHTLTMSADATASGAAVSLKVVGQVPLAPGETVSGPGIPAGATISSIAANGDLTLSANATASASGVALHVGLPFDASAAEVQSDLEALNGIGAGNVAVSGAAGGPWTVEFTGGLADLHLEAIRIDGSGLTPPSGASVKTLAEGANAPEVCTAAELQAGYACSHGVPSAAEGELQATPLPLALDSSGDVWVGGLDRLEEFSPEGEFLSEAALPGAGKVPALAIDPASGDFYTLTLSSGEADEVQQVNPPESGDYTLTFGGQTTKAVNAEASLEVEAEALQKDLEALPSIGAGNVQVSAQTAFLDLAVRFVGELGDKDVEQMSASGGATVETVTQGAPGVPGAVTKRQPSGEALETVGSTHHPRALAVDPATGYLFVAEKAPEANFGATLLEFSPGGEQVEAFATGEVIGDPIGNALAFGDTAQRLYVVSEGAQAFPLPEPGPLPIAGSSEAKEVGKVKTTLCAEVNPEGKPTIARFQYLTDATYQAQRKQAEEEGKTPSEVAEAAFAGATQSAESSLVEDFSPHRLCQEAASLKPATAYRFRLFAHNTNGTTHGGVARFETLPPAAIDSTSVSEVTATSATLQADINPLGDTTSYRFEYLPEARFLENEANQLPPFAGALQAPLQGAPIGAGPSDVAVSQHIQGLLPHTPYRFRAVAINAVAEANGGPFAGPTRAFTTQGTGSGGLPDHRAWELVSPPDKHGADLKTIGLAFIKAAAGGDAIVYEASSPTETDPAGNPLATAVLSSRGSGGWSSLDLNNSHTEPVSIGSEYRSFSEDLSQAMLQPLGPFDPSLSAAASEQGPYLRSDFASGAGGAFCSQLCYRPVVSGCPKTGEPCPSAVEEAADVPPGTQFGGNCPTYEACGPRFLGASPDFSHLIVSSEVALTAEPISGSALYEYSAGAPRAEALRLISALPSGKPVAKASLDLGSRGDAARRAISADGSRVIWSTGNGNLYLRVTAKEEQSKVSGTAVDGSQCTEPEKACTAQLDALQGGPGGAQSPSARFQLASAEGSRIFFTDTQQLTLDSGGGSNHGGDLYEYDLEKPAGERLTDLTPASNGEPAGVQGLLLGASKDGSYLYFVADGVLANNTVENGGGPEEARPGGCGAADAQARCNLYVRYAGTTTFIATVSEMDAPSWAGSSGTLVGLTSRVSANGRWLAFMSQRPLSGYDNRDATSGVPDEEVFLYHAPAGGGEGGKLLCASCNPTGARPHGKEYNLINAGNTGLAGGTFVWGGSQWLAANIPGWTRRYHQSRYLSDSGRLFFNSSDALVPQDSNGTEDVYEYEPPSSAQEAPPNDTCAESSPTYSPASGGCVSLISSGTSPKESAFIDASESGNDVFFLTSSSLAPQDRDTSLDVYDARAPHAPGEAVGFPEAPKPVECSGDACQAPANPPNDPTPGTLTHNGPGNERPPVRKHCRKGLVRRHGRCAKKHRRAAHGRAASHKRRGRR